MDKTPTLRLDGLSKTYGSGDSEVIAVNDVSLTASEGEFLALVGPSGSGKTTLLAMIGGLLSPTSGTVEVEGRDIASFSGGERMRYRRDRVGYVFQLNNLLPFLTARENLLVVKAIGGREANAERADALLEEFGIGKKRDTLGSQLSAGERQRVAIARALMNDPALLLVDEPTASLDSTRGRQVVELLVREAKDRGKLGLMVTHDLEMAELADKVLEMRDGALTGSA